MKVVWKRKGGEVVVEGTMPPEIICDCGSNSFPKAVARAERITALPEIEWFLTRLFERIEVRETVGRREATIRVGVKSLETFKEYLDSKGVEVSFNFQSFDKRKAPKAEEEPVGEVAEA